MSGGTPVEHIDAVDALARTLYIQSKDLSSTPTGASLNFDTVADAVRQFHVALRHLRVEAADTDSLLNIGRSENGLVLSTQSPAAAPYVNQVQSIVDDCTRVLQQLESLIHRYSGGTDEAAHGRVSAIRARLLNEKTNIELFLNTVQLRNPASPVPPPRPFDANTQDTLEGIKDKVDAIAARLFSQQSSSALNDDALWKEFKTELENEGFSRAVLQKHKDVLRAYIRELESMSELDGGNRPTVRGLLAYEASSAPKSPKEFMDPAMENEKCFPSMKYERRMPDHAPALPERPPRGSFERRSDTSDDSALVVPGDALALISTKDLVAMDNLNASMGALQLHRPAQPNYTYATPRSSGKSLDTLPAPELAELAGSPSSHLLSASPRQLPPYPGSYPGTSPAAIAAGGAGPPPAYSTSPQQGGFRLAPDRYGREIPMEAKWTKIKRTIVSPQVLERSGVRYEARPEFVAVLGHLTPEQIADFARQSADVRAARSSSQSGRQPQPRSVPRYSPRDSRNSHVEDLVDDDSDSDLWDEIDEADSSDDRYYDEKGHRSYPYIVSPPEKEKLSPSSTTQPKPILKNKNENKVRFDPEPHEIENKSPRQIKEDRERSRDRYGDRRRPRHRRPREHRDREGSSSRYDRERDGSSSRYYDDNRDRNHRRDTRDRDRERERDRFRVLNDEYYGSRGHSYRSPTRDEPKKKKGRHTTLGAVGIGGAAVSLLGVLAEAASAMT